MEDPYWTTLHATEEANTTFPELLDKAERACTDDEGFLQTIRTHKLKFKAGEDYTLLTKDYRYLVELLLLDIAMKRLSRRS